MADELGTAGPTWEREDLNTGLGGIRFRQRKVSASIVVRAQRCRLACLSACEEKRIALVVAELQKA